MNFLSLKTRKKTFVSKHTLLKLTLFIVESECRIQEFLIICQPDQNYVPHFGFNLPQDLELILLELSC